MRILLGIGLLAGTLFAQKPDVYFEHLSIDRGLSQSAVSAIMQDNDGFMWFGTQEGLNRYDGYQFVVYRQDPADSFSLSDNYIWSIKKDPSGFLWIGTNLGGLNRLDPVTGRFEPIRHDPVNPLSLSHNSVRSIHVGKDGDLWVGTRNGLNYKDGKRGGFVRYFHDPDNPNSIPGNIVRSVIEDHEGLIWIGTNNGVSVYDRKSARFWHYQHVPSDPRSISDNTIWSIYEDRERRIWIGTRNGGLNLFDRQTGNFVRFRHDPKNNNSLGQEGVWTIFQDRRGILWLGTEGGGVNEFHPAQKRFIRHTPELNRPGSLSHGIVQSVYEDRSGLIWIGTFGGGINVYYPGKNKFLHFKNDPHNKNSLSYNYVWAIFEDHRGDIWIGTEGGGLNLFSRDKNIFKHFRKQPDQPSSLISDIIRCLWEDADRNLWIGTEDGLDRWDSAKQRFIHYKPDKNNSNSLSHQVVYSIRDDKQGYLWVGTQGGGLNRIHKSTMTFKHYFHDPSVPTGLKSNIVRIIYIDRNETMWIGTDNGLSRYDPATDGFVHYVHDPENPNSLSRNMTLCIHEDRSGYLWAGTFGGGLNRLNRETGLFTRITQKDGLANDVVYGILEDRHGSLWVSTNRGISKISIRNDNTLRIRNYDIHDGLQSDEFNQSSYCRTRDGHLLFGGINGFNLFDPDSIRDLDFIPPVVLTSILKFNRPFQSDTNIHWLRHLHLSHKDYVFSFEFAALSFAFPGKNQYAYKMENFDDDWIYSGNRRFVTYTNLDPGRYVFRVKGSNADGVWNEEGLALAMTVHPPFWNTLWFKVLILLLIFGSAFMGYTVRIKKIEQQKKKLEIQVADRTKEIQQKTILLESANQELVRLNDLKNEFLGIAAHDLRNPLSAIIGFIDLIIQDIKEQAFDPAQSLSDLESILSSGKQMSHLISELLDISAIESGKINLSLHQENLQTIFDDCEALHRRRALQKNIKLIVEKHANIPPVLIDRSRIAEVVDNLLSNAIKYTFPGGEVRLFCEIRLDHVVTNIKDNGQGLSDEDIRHLFEGFKKLSAKPTAGESSTGLGLAIVKKIVTLHGGEVWVTSQKNIGSTFSFSVPINGSAGNPENG